MVIVESSGKASAKMMRRKMEGRKLSPVSVSAYLDVNGIAAIETHHRRRVEDKYNCDGREKSPTREK
jgi:hypothetical protein